MGDKRQREHTNKRLMRQEHDRTQRKLPKQAKGHLQRIVDEWDASGRVKTSIYWRLVSQLEERT